MMIDGLLILILTICVITDLRERKIYNAVIFPGMAAVLVIRPLTEGLSGAGSALAGFAVGLSLLLIPYFLGGMGAGDVKLLALIGSFKGTAFVLAAAAYMAFIGAVIAVLILLFRKRIREWLHWVAYSMYSLLHGVKLPFIIAGESMSATYPYGVAIAGGTLLAFWMKEWVIR